MGGGHSFFSPKFGLGTSPSFPFIPNMLTDLGVDNVLQFTIVLADGSVIITNSFQYPDLFWALRGGGGGTYGIVISTTYQTHPTFPLTLALISANFSSPDIAQNVTTEFIKLHSTISEAGWGGFIDLSNSSFSATLSATNISWLDTNTTFLPFVQYVSEATGGLVQATTTPFNSFFEVYQALFANIDGGVGFPNEVASRLLSRNLAETDPSKVAKIMLSLDGVVTIK